MKRTQIWPMGEVTKWKNVLYYTLISSWEPKGNYGDRPGQLSDSQRAGTPTVRGKESRLTEPTGGVREIQANIRAPWTTHPDCVMMTVGQQRTALLSKHTKASCTAALWRQRKGLRAELWLNFDQAGRSQGGRKVISENVNVERQTHPYTSKATQGETSPKGIWK